MNLSFHPGHSWFDSNVIWIARPSMSAANCQKQSPSNRTISFMFGNTRVPKSKRNMTTTNFALSKDTGQGERDHP